MARDEIALRELESVPLILVEEIVRDALKRAASCNHCVCHRGYLFVATFQEKSRCFKAQVKYPN